MTGAEARLGLAPYQTTAVESLQAVLERVAEYHLDRPEHRTEIALKTGVMLLQSPTGSGKTLILGRALEGMKGRLGRPTVWFWFAPYTGIVMQTAEALAAQCPALRLRSVADDREMALAKDGDVYVQTWGTVAAKNRDARRVRRSGEDALSLDDMIEGLRDEGFFFLSAW